MQGTHIHLVIYWAEPSFARSIRYLVRIKLANDSLLIQQGTRI